MLVEILLGAALWLTASGAASGAAPERPAVVGEASDRARLLEAAREVMVAARYCTLVTLDRSGHPRARVMDPFPPEEDLTVWMGTNRSTRKVAELEADPRATLSCFDPGGVGYVTLLGEASLVDDPAERESRFKPEWREFYEDEYRGADYVLIRFEPRRLEIVSLAHSIASGPRAWKPAVVELRP